MRKCFVMIQECLLGRQGAILAASQLLFPRRTLVSIVSGCLYSLSLSLQLCLSFQLCCTACAVRKHFRPLP